MQSNISPGSVKGTPNSVTDEVLDCGQCTRVVFLSQPECCLLPNGCTSMRAHELVEQWNGLIVGKLRDAEDGFGAHLFVGIVVARVAQTAGSLPRRGLRKPEERIATRL